MENDTKQCDTSMYKSLCICSPEFEKIPIERRELGIAGVVISHTLTIGGAYIPEKIPPIEANRLIRQLPTSIITINFGIISFLIKLIEGKSLECSGIEIGTETTLSTLGGIGGKAAAQQGLSQTSKLASSGATRLAASKVASNTATKVGISLLTRIATGAAAGAVAGSAAPIVGTIIGAVAGALIAGFVNDAIFAEEDKQTQKDKAENELIKQKEIKYQNKINRINDYLIRNHYIELRELTESESEALCKEASNIHSSYFKTIILMLSFPNYLDRDIEFYNSLQENQQDSNNTESKIQPIANAIPLRLAIQECYDSAKGALLKNTTIYIYNHRFQRVVAKGKTDSKGSLIIDNVSVGQERGIDKLSFIVDRDNLSERVA